MKSNICELLDSNDPCFNSCQPGNYEIIDNVNLEFDVKKGGVNILIEIINESF